MRSLDEIQINASIEQSTRGVAGAGVNVRRGDWIARRARTLDARSARAESNRCEANRTTLRTTPIYPDDDFGAGLREIARLVKARVGLEAACIDLGGWDTHFFQGSTGGLQAEQIDLLARGLAAFDADLGRERDRVTVIVMTEFGRRVYENGSLGTDHGRGFAMMAIGAQINGGKIHGAKPDLSPDDEELLGPGGIKIACDYRSALTEVLAGLLGNHNIEKVFPDLNLNRSA